MDPELSLKKETTRAHSLREELAQLESKLSEYKSRIDKKMPAYLESLKVIYQNKKEALQRMMTNQKKTGINPEIIKRYTSEIKDLEKKLGIKQDEEKISRETQKTEKPKEPEAKNINLNSLVNSLITFGKNNENQISDDILLDMIYLPKEKVKQIMEEAMNEFHNQQKNLQPESRFKKVLSFFRGKNESQIREDQFLNGFAKLQTTIFKASPEVLSQAVARGVANKERVGQIEDNLTSNAGYNIEKENIK